MLWYRRYCGDGKAFMDVIRGIEQIPTGLTCAAVTIGNFDGVHLGHRFIFERLVAEARREGCKAAVITFDPHPKMVLHPERQPFYLLTTVEEKSRLIAALGVDVMILIPFTLDYARTTAEAFVRDILWERLRVRKVLIGHDYTFGRGKEGNETFLREAGGRLGFAVEVISPIRVGETTVSSTQIRKALLVGEVRFAASLLGRPYNLRGEVIRGSGRGGGLGFPTANILPEKALLPSAGVYAVRVLVEGRERDGVLSIGCNPTFAGQTCSVEVHLLDVAENLYGKTIDLHFIERLRDAVRFATPAALTAQIERDIRQARTLLKP